MPALQSVITLCCPARIACHAASLLPHSPLLAAVGRRRDRLRSGSRDARDVFRDRAAHAAADVSKVRDAYS